MTHPLTRRERQIVQLVARGFGNELIAEVLGLAPQTVKNHVHAAYVKTGCRDRRELALWLAEEQP